MAIKKKVLTGIIEPGDTARCAVTKIEGIVVVRHDYLYGVPRIGIQPSGSFEGKQHEAIHMDMPQAELLEKKTVSRSGMIPTSKVNLGDEGKDKITGFKGICVGKAEWLYACTKVALQSKELKDKAPLDPVWFDEPQIDVRKEQVLTTDTKTTGGFGKSTYKDNRHNSGRKF
jgi:hypothetical protein